MPYGEVLDEETERVATIVVDSIFKVHATLGPGLLESIYVFCLVLELQSRGLKVQREVPVAFYYLGQEVHPKLRLDLIVEDRIIVEAKAVEILHPIDFSKTKSYLKAAHKRLAFLVNFNVILIKDGIKRIIL